jgi:hypothetical protein
VLLRMVPDALVKIWPDIKGHIASALPEGERGEAALNKLLESLLQNVATCWISYDPKNENRPNFAMVLLPIYDSFVDERNLNIYSITRFDDIDLKTSNRMWLDGFVALRKYMKANGFSKLVGHFDLDNFRSLKMAEKFGAKIRHYIEIDMTREV